MTATVLVVGAPRSGTTWVARTLALGCGASYVEEPDNHFRFGFAYRAKRDLGRCGTPSVLEDDPDPRLEQLALLWDAALAPGRAGPTATARRAAANRLLAQAGPLCVDGVLSGSHPETMLLRATGRLAHPERDASPGPRIAKSVYATLCVEWLAARRDVSVVVVQRSPLRIVSSWLELGWLQASWPDPLSTLHPDALDELLERFHAPRPPASRLGRAALLVGLLVCAQEASATEKTAWRRVVHEELASDPHAGFRALAAETGLTWSIAGDELLDRSNRPGSGYELARVATDLVDTWRRRLDDGQVAEVRSILAGLPLPAALLP